MKLNDCEPVTYAKSGEEGKGIYTEKRNGTICTPAAIINAVKSRKNNKLPPVLNHKNHQKTNGHIIPKPSNHVIQQKEERVEQRKEVTTFKKREQRKRAGESFEECSLWDAFCTYLCYAVLVLVGYVNDFVRPRTAKEKHRDVSFFAIIKSLYIH